MASTITRAASTGGRRPENPGRDALAKNDEPNIDLVEADLRDTLYERQQGSRDRSRSNTRD